MKAMILAAGVGSRLKPLTDAMPKALAEVGGVPMLEIVARRLIRAGVDGIIVNTHHFAERIARFVEEKNGFGVRVELSREQELLDTGGGLKKAAWFFDDGRPFFVHNADAFTDFDLRAMLSAHEAGGALASIAVAPRRTSRGLAIGPDGLLRRRWKDGPGCAGCTRVGFNTVHVVSPEIFGLMKEEGKFSIMDVYLRLASEGRKIAAVRTDGRLWVDIGTPETLELARRLAAERGLPE